ncbi:MAG: hypothetical protein IJ458_01700 [Clostridia bacterium]|nr:hypothetical protein [Clostridia bacterium]
MYLSELLQKPLLCLYEGELLGNINRVFFDKSKKKIKYFEILNDEEISYCLYPKFIYTLGKHAITIKNKQNLILSLNDNSTNAYILPINAKVYSLQGEYLGIVKDYSITEKYVIENLILDNQQLINIDDMASCSTNSIVVYYSEQHVNINSFRYRIKNKNNDTSKVKVLPKLFSSFNKISPNPSNKKENFIVGRICTKDIFDNQQNIIIKQHSTITEQTLALASSKNKLQELMKYSKNK